MWKLPQGPFLNEPYAWSRNAFTEEEIELIKTIGYSLPLKDGRVNDGENNQDTRRSKISLIKPESDTIFIFEKIYNQVRQINNSFYEFELTDMEDLQFSEYDSEYQGVYKNHADDGYNVQYNRKLSFSLQLTSPEEYSGGDLLLYRFKLENPFEVKKEKGLLAVFPSYTIHEVTPVTEGRRITLVGWFHGPKFR